jgi:RNA methyltransferase, TrmH family
MRCRRRCSETSMGTRLITSKHNPLLRTMRLAASRARRAAAELVLAEGIRSVEEATAAGWVIEAGLVSTHFGNARREKQILEQWCRRGVGIYQAPDDIVRSISDVVTPQGIVALIRVPARSLSEFRVCSEALILCTWGIQDPGNLGTLIRTASAAGAAMVCTLTGTVSPRNPKAVRSSAGAFFRIPVIEDIVPEQFFGHCKAQAITVYLTSANRGIAYSQADLKGPCAIIVGNEGGGVPKGEWSTLPSLRIPMAPGVESLNVSAAGAVLMFEAHRQRAGVCRI